MVRTIFVPALPDRPLTSSLAAAETVARTYRAHIRCLFVADRIIPSPGMELGWSDELVTSAEEASAEMADNLGRTFLEFCTAHTIDVVDEGHIASPPRIEASWATAKGAAEETLSMAAREADLIVLARPDRPSPASCRYEEALVARSGRPVLLAPSSPPKTLPGHPLIAWNGSREATRALALAMPLIQHAGRATILSVGPLERGVPSAEEIAVSLRRHDIRADSRSIEKADGGVLASITSAAAEARADLLVLGAYSHAQWREVVLGGVTREILKAGDIPALLAH